MKIKKIKSQGEFVYPATIAAAVKDANFLKEDNKPMTQGEINLYFNDVLEGGINSLALEFIDMCDNYPKPQRLIYIWLNSELPIPAAKADGKIPGTVEINIDGNIIKKYCTFEVQGLPSATLPKKNLTFVFYNDEERTSKYKFRLNNMPAHSDYVYKANYIDITHGRNIGCNRLWEQIIYAHEDGPFRTTEALSQIDTGALCHVDGFPCVVYFNGEFYGIGDFNIGKKIQNYDLDETNQNHIQIQANARVDFLSFTPGEGTGQWEIRCPKVPDSSFTTRAVKFFENNNVTDLDRFKTLFEVHHDKRNAIDYYIFAEFCYLEDIVDNNTIATSWNGGEMWYMFPYDLDACFGLKYDGKVVTPAASCGSVKDSTISGAIPAGISSKQFWNTFVNAYRGDIARRYDELKNKYNIFTVANISKIFSELQRPFGKFFNDEITKWGGGPSSGITSLKQILDWTKERIEWMDLNYGEVLPES